MLIMTYPLVKDPKILLSVMDNVFLSLSSSINSIVTYERLFKRIPVSNDNFDSRFAVFRSKIVDRYKINKEYITLIQEVNSILKEHKKSPVEFSRQNKFVICSENYRLKTIGVPDLKKTIIKTKLFISEIERLVSKNAGIFK